MERQRISPDELKIELGKRKRISPDELKIELGKNKLQIKDKIGRLESLGIGAEQGLSLESSDEIRGAIGAAKEALKGDYNPDDVEDSDEMLRSIGKRISSHKTEDIVKKYKELRDAERERIKKASEEQPGYYYGGEIGSGLLTSFIPGSAARTAGKAVSLGSKLKRGAAVGGLAGLGSSKEELSEKPLETAKDIASGAAIGGAASGLFHGIEQVGKKIGTINKENLPERASRLGEAFLDTDRKLIEQYIKDPNSIKNAKSRLDIAKEIIEDKETLKNKLIEESNKVKDFLNKSGVAFDPKKISSIYYKEAQKIENSQGFAKTDPIKESTKNWLLNMGKEWDKYSDVGTIPYTDIRYGVKIPANRIKEEVKSLNLKNYQHKVSGGEFEKIDNLIKKRVAGKLRENLSSIPGYEDKMKNPRELAKLLKESSEHLKDEQTISNKLKKIHTDEFGTGQIPVETLEKLGKTFKKDYIKMSELSRFKEMLENSSTHGSKNVNKFSKLVEDIPVLKNFGGVIGHYADIKGRKIAISAIDKAIELNNKKNTKEYDRILSDIIQKANKYSLKDQITLELVKASNPYIKDKIGLEE